jgi:hypothetical protein
MRRSHIGEYQSHSTPANSCRVIRLTPEKSNGRPQQMWGGEPRPGANETTTERRGSPGRTTERTGRRPSQTILRLPPAVLRAPWTALRPPRTILRLPQTVRRLPRTVRRLPRTVPRLPRTVPRLPRTAPRLPRTALRPPRTVRHPSRTVRERQSQAHLNLPEPKTTATQAHLNLRKAINAGNGATSGRVSAIFPKDCM